MPSIYLKCDKCGAVLDRRVKSDFTHDGTYHRSQEKELRRFAEGMGWKRMKTPESHDPEVTVDYCRACCASQSPIEKRRVR